MMMQATISPLSLEDVLTQFSSKHTSLTCLQPYHPRVTMEERATDHYSIFDGSAMRYYLTMQEASLKMRSLVRKHKKDEVIQEEILSYGIEHHYGTVPVYTIAQLGDSYHMDKHNSTMSTADLQNELRVAYQALHKYEQDLANIMGFPNMGAALTHDHVQHLLSHYTPFELLTLKQTEVLSYQENTCMDVTSSLLGGYGQQNPHVQGGVLGTEFAQRIEAELFQKQREVFQHNFFTVHQQLVDLIGEDLSYPMGWVHDLVDYSMPDLYTKIDASFQSMQRDMENYMTFHPIP